MAIGEIINAITSTPEIANDILLALGQIGLWLKAIGIVIIIWLIFHVVSVLFNTKRMKEVKNIKGDIIRIEEKIDKLLAIQEKKKSKDKDE